MEALNYKNVPKTFRRFVADSHIRFKYTAEFENPKYSLNFLNINITNNTANKKYKFKVHRKDTITNIHIKPNSYINPSTTKSVFKGFLHHAHTIYSGTYIKEKTQFLTYVFLNNGN